MSASQYRGQLERKRKQRLDAEKKANEYRTKESKKRADAAAARKAALKTTNQSTARSKAREAERREDEAKTAGTEASRCATRAAGYARDEANIASRLAKAEQSEAAAAERARQREQQQVTRKATAQQIALSNRLSQAEAAVERIGRQLPEPQPEKLRILILGASADGGLRVGREQKRIRAAIETALHRDYVELDVRPAATTEDLLDGIAKFRPHVVHFSGHSNEESIEFEDEVDEPHAGVVATARAFANAVRATDQPPILVMLNSCLSSGHLDRLVADVVPFAIGMADEIEDGDAIAYAARFYANVANGQSIHAAHAAGRAALELAGLDGADLPTLAWAEDVDPTTATAEIYDADDRAAHDYLIAMRNKYIAHSVNAFEQAAVFAIISGDSAEELQLEGVGTQHASLARLSRARARQIATMCERQLEDIDFRLSEAQADVATELAKRGPEFILSLDELGMMTVDESAVNRGRSRPE